jgi:hypothetical protein
VIDVYAKGWKPPSYLTDAGRRPGKLLLEKFGSAATKVSKPPDDGTVLWLPVEGSITEATSNAVLAEAGKKSGEVLAVGYKSTFDRIKNGTRSIWCLDIRGGPRHRKVTLHRVLREVLLPTDDDMYFAVVGKAERSIRLTLANKQVLKGLGLVQRIDSLRSNVKILRAGKAAKLMALAVPRR